MQGRGAVLRAQCTLSISDLFCPCWVEYMSPRTTGWKRKWPHLLSLPATTAGFVLPVSAIQGSVRASAGDTVRVSLNYKLQLTPGTLASYAEGPAERRGIVILVGLMETQQEMEVLFQWQRRGICVACRGPHQAPLGTPLPSVDGKMGKYSRHSLSRTGRPGAPTSQG